MAAQASLRKVNAQFGRGLLEEQPFLGSCYLRGLTLYIKQFSGLDQSCWLFSFFFFLLFFVFLRKNGLLGNRISVYNSLLDSHTGTAAVNVGIRYSREKGASNDLPWAEFKNCPGFERGWI